MRKRIQTKKAKDKVLRKNSVCEISSPPLQCPECGGRVIRDNNEYYCSDCGLVLDQIYEISISEAIKEGHGDIMDSDASLGTGMIGQHMAHDKDENPDFEEEEKLLKKELAWLRRY
jgi:transcription initiation factor TFIIIB Brf1 subunit/transcription initiation factor TFIIB